MASDMRKLLATDSALSDSVLAIQYCEWFCATDYWLSATDSLPNATNGDADVLMS